MCYIIPKRIKQGYSGYLLLKLYLKDFILPLCIHNLINMN